MKAHTSLFIICLMWLSCSSFSRTVFATTPVEIQYRIVKQYPHNPDIFTQGLEYHEGQLLESAGKFGQSSLSLRNLDSTEILKQVSVDKQYFAEGITELDGRIYQLTWQSGKVFVYAADSFKLLREFTIKGEGWGLTNNGTELIMSNGSDKLYFINPQDFTISRSLAITHQGRALTNINELEWVEGNIYANIWQTDWIVIINSLTGHVTGQVNLQALRQPGSDVLNGIAYDRVKQSLFVTGKYWPQLYQIELLTE